MRYIEVRVGDVRSIAIDREGRTCSRPRREQWQEGLGDKNMQV